jgi:putative membrane protein
MMFSRLLRNAVALAATVAIGACTTETGEPVDSLALTDTVSLDTQISAGATADGWNDAQIFGLLAMMNGGRLAAAELARARATNPEVKALADSIDRAHLEMERELSALATRLNVTPAAPDDSAVIEEQNEDMAELQRASAGREWDREFVDELEDWQEDTRDILTRAIESTHTPELRQTLMDMRTRLEQQLAGTNELKERLG